MVRRAIEQRFGEVDVVIIKVFRWITRAIIKVDAHVILADDHGVVAIVLKHFWQRRHGLLNHRPVGSMRQPPLILKVGPMRKATGEQGVSRRAAH